MKTEVRRSTWFFVAVLAGATLLLGGDVFRGEISMVSAIAAAAISMVVVGLLLRVWNGDPVIVFDEHGIYDRRWGFNDPIPWSQVADVRQCGVREICLELSTPAPDKPTNSTSVRTTEESLLRLETHAWGLNISHQALFDAIQERFIKA